MRVNIEGDHPSPAGSHCPLREETDHNHGHFRSPGLPGHQDRGDFQYSFCLISWSPHHIRKMYFPFMGLSFYKCLKTSLQRAPWCVKTWQLIVITSHPGRFLLCLAVMLSLCEWDRSKYSATLGKNAKGEVLKFDESAFLYSGD